MKKTMFITSVIMVVVMAIALTTSSLAWFSVNGQATVTTNTLQLTASAGGSTGIQISHDKLTWASDISLSDSNAGNLMPVVPFLKGDTANAGNFLKALVGGTEDAYVAPSQGEFGPVGGNEYLGTIAANTPYASFMVGNKIDANGDFSENVIRNGYYTDTFYIKNVATGTAQDDAKLQAAIAFLFENDANADVAYTLDNRDKLVGGIYQNAGRYANDAKLCVAVLLRKNEFVADSDDREEILGETPDVGQYLSYNATNYEDWELLVYADSKGGTTVSLGKNAAAFTTGAASNASCSTVDITAFANNTVTSTELIRPEREWGGLSMTPDIKTVRVVAWYEGATLSNNNSEVANLKFNLTFTKVSVDTYNKLTPNNPND